MSTRTKLVIFVLLLITSGMAYSAGSFLGSSVAINYTPSANPQTVNTLQNQAVDVSMTAVDQDGDSLTYVVVTQPANGALSGLMPNTGFVNYAPDLDYVGIDSFSFAVSDGVLQSDPVLVSITIDPDSDGDGLSDSVENQQGTNPNNVDSDSDGLVDGAGGVVSTIIYPSGIDIDGDGFVDGEQDLGTDPAISNLGDLAPRGAPDNLINTGDLLVLTRMVTGIIMPTGLELYIGDLNRDAQLNTPDLLLLQKAVINDTPP